MPDMHKLSEQVIDYAERAADVADAAKGKGRSNGSGSRWLLLPAAGAAFYALVRSDFFARRAKVVADEAKSRASELPDDLMKAVRQTSQTPTRRATSQASRRGTSRSRRGARSSRSTSSR